MKIKKVKNTGNKKWPKKVEMYNGLSYRIPQQKEFCDFSKKHGCSLAAVSIALQSFGISKTPTEIYLYAKKNLGGYSGSKLTIYGCKTVINKMLDKNVATWHHISKSTKRSAIRSIRKALKQNKIVLIETDSPIHTNVIIAKRPGGVWNATNGKLVKTTVRSLVNDAYICASRKDNWWPKSSGYVIVDTKL